MSILTRSEPRYLTRSMASDAGSAWSPHGRVGCGRNPKAEHRKAAPPFFGIPAVVAIYAFLVVTTESHPEARSGGIVTGLGLKLKTLRPEIALV